MGRLFSAECENRPSQPQSDNESWVASRWCWNSTRIKLLSWKKSCRSECKVSLFLQKLSSKSHSHICPLPINVVFPDTQTTLFSNDNVQMGLFNQTRLHFQPEVIIRIDDLCDFTKTGSWTHMLDNYKRPPQVMVANIFVNQPMFYLPAKSLMRLNLAAQAVESYLDTGRALSASGMIWTNRLWNLQAEKESLDEMKKE